MEKAAKLWSEIAELQEEVVRDEVYVAVMIVLQKSLSAAKEAVVELLPAVKKFLDLRVNVEKKACSAGMELSSIKHRELSFHKAMKAVRKELSAAKLEYAALQWKWDEGLSKVNVLHTDLGESLRTLSKRTTQGSSMMS